MLRGPRAGLLFFKSLPRENKYEVFLANGRGAGQFLSPLESWPREKYAVVHPWGYRES